MSVLIKGMEMPKNCHECRLYEGDIYYCSAADKMIDISDSSEGKCQFCPLVPVPKHGDLIDRDALKPYMLNEHYKHRLVFDADEVANAPTIIPAEEGEM